MGAAVVFLGVLDDGAFDMGVVSATLTCVMIGVATGTLAGAIVGVAIALLAGVFSGAMVGVSFFTGVSIVGVSISTGVSIVGVSFFTGVFFILVLVLIPTALTSFPVPFQPSSLSIRTRRDFSNKR